MGTQRLMLMSLTHVTIISTASLVSAPLWLFLYYNYQRNSSPKHYKSVIIYFSSCCTKPVWFSFFSGTQKVHKKKVFWAHLWANEIYTLSLIFSIRIVPSQIWLGFSDRTLCLISMMRLWINYPATQTVVTLSEPHWFSQEHVWDISLIIIIKKILYFALYFCTIRSFYITSSH